MSQELPRDFESDDEIAEWFDNVDLSGYVLEPADVRIAAQVRLVLEEDLSPPPTSAAATAETHLELVGHP